MIREDIWEQFSLSYSLSNIIKLLKSSNDGVLVLYIVCIRIYLYKDFMKQSLHLKE